MVLQYYFVLFPFHVFSSPFFFLSNSDPGRSLVRLVSFLPTTGRALHFYRDKSSARSFLVDARRIERAYYTPITLKQALSTVGVIWT